MPLLLSKGLGRGLFLSPKVGSAHKPRTHHIDGVLARHSYLDLEVKADSIL